MDRHSFAPFGEALKIFRQNQHLTQQQLATRLGVHRNTIGSWERGDYLPEHRGIVLDLAKHLRLGDLEARQLLEASLTAISPYWSVPVPRNPCFTGRETVLQRLHTQLAHQQPVALTQTSALSGLGGIGKTQIAVEYAYRYALEYSAVFWVAAETPETLMSSVQQIAEQLHLPERQAAKQSQMVTAVQDWLATHTGWLLVMDNVEDPELVQMVLPPARQGACLLTTRRRALGPLVELLEVPIMTSEEGVDLLQRRAQGRPVSEPSPVSAAAMTLVDLLEGLPLALDQAGAYIEETGCGIEMYLGRFHDQRKHVLAHRGTHGRAHPDSVTTTFLLAVAQIEHKNPAAANLLRLCAFLHPEEIPEELFSAEEPHLRSVLGPVAADPYQFDLALAALRNASLVTRHPEARTLSIHRLVQAVLQDQMAPVEARLWSAHAVRAVNAVFPEPEFSMWAQCERCLAQALACVPLLALAGDDLPEASELLFKTGSYLLERGHYQAAEPILVQAVALGEQQYGTNHPALIPLLEKQGELYWRQEKYEPIERLLHRTLTLAEQHLGPAHLRTAETLTHLASLYEKQKKSEQAEVLYQRALSIQEQQLSFDHPMLATTLNNLGIIYRMQGKYEAAEPLYQRALSIREHQLGFNHPQTATPLHNLALMYRLQKKYEQAETLHQRALRIQEQQLGPDHPQTALTRKNLAVLYREQGKDEQAEALYQQTLTRSEQLLGSAHPQTMENRKETLSISSERTLTLFPQENNALQRFIRDCCELHPQAWSPSNDLWQAYERWAEDQQERFPLSRRAFTDQLKAYGCHADRTSTARIWRGIALTSNRL